MFLKDLYRKGDIVALGIISSDCEIAISLLFKEDRIFRGGYQLVNINYKLRFNLAPGRINPNRIGWESLIPGREINVFLRSHGIGFSSFSHCRRILSTWHSKKFMMKILVSLTRLDIDAEMMVCDNKGIETCQKPINLHKVTKKKAMEEFKRILTTDKSSPHGFLAEWCKVQILDLYEGDIQKYG